MAIAIVSAACSATAQGGDPNGEARRRSRIDPVRLWGEAATIGVP